MGMLENYMVNNRLNSNLFCDLCGSTEIAETETGYVCKECGIELKYQKFKFHLPFDENELQNNVVNKTQIGKNSERTNSTNSYRLERLNKIHNSRDYEARILDIANVEICRIFSSLDLPYSLRELVFRKLKRVRKSLRSGTKYRSPEKLVPIYIYFLFKFQNIVIKEKSLLEVSNISKVEFNAFKFQIIDHFPEYFQRERRDYILQVILGIVEHFELGMKFYHQSRKILNRLWDIIKFTKDDVIAGVITSISALSAPKTKITVSSICKHIGIAMSTIQSQIKKRIFDKLGIPGFASLVKSSSLLKSIMIKLGLIKPEIIEITLGTATQIYNHFSNPDFYFYIFNIIHDLPISTILRLFKIGKEKIKRSKHTIRQHLFKLAILRLSKINGPPPTTNGKINQIYNDLEKKRSKLNEFLEYFSNCPICNRENHRNYLKKFYFNFSPKKKMLQERLIKLLDESDQFKDKYYNKISIGIPCCKCHRRIKVVKEE